MEILRALCILIGSVVLGALGAFTVLALISFVADLLPSKEGDQ